MITKKNLLIIAAEIFSLPGLIILGVIMMIRKYILMMEHKLSIDVATNIMVISSIVGWIGIFLAIILL